MSSSPQSILDSAPALVLSELKQMGPCDATALSEALDVTPTAVRQHLYLLQSKGLVSHQLETRPMGRPAKIWKATRKADAFFADAHGQLLTDFLESTSSVVGEEGLCQIIDCYGRTKRATYFAKTSRSVPLNERLRTLAELRNDEGFMAETTALEDGTYLFVESHCPISKAATQCRQFCDLELSLFQEILGDDVSVEREEHMFESGARCSYRIRQRETESDASCAGEAGC